ncbi:response regulator [Maribacter chungangensis]|uniref:Response regulator n=1 Tax=Maribacter chungangensis TaxID=1069117 RepID=A0ABW3B6U4_9FLAO
MKYELILIEDDPIFTFLLEKAIAGAGLEGTILNFSNGLPAIAYFKKNYTKAGNYIIFLDLNMPNMDGYEFMDTFKKMAHTDNTMVFILTSSRSQRDMDIFEHNPFVAKYITKPISEAIIKSLKELIEEKFGEASTI